MHVYSYGRAALMCSNPLTRHSVCQSDTKTQISPKAAQWLVQVYLCKCLPILLIVCKVLHKMARDTIYARVCKWVKLWLGRVVVKSIFRDQNCEKKHV